jgi:O-succinylbenzoic acid--CoA ligase
VSGDWLAARARTDPNSLALIDGDTGTRWSYQELFVRVRRLAVELREIGVEVGDRVGVVATRDPKTVSVLWAVLRAGAVLAPLEATAPAGKIRNLAGVAGLDHLVVEPARRDEVAAEFESGQRVHSMDSLTGSGTTESPAGRGRWRHRRGLDETRILLFTSGTTGDPKAVRLTPRNVGASAAGSAFRLGVEPEDRWVLTLPLYHMGGLAIVLRAAIYGTAVVLEREFDAPGTARTIEAYDATGISLVPTMLRRLLDDDWSPATLRFALVGGAPTPESLARRALAAGVPLHTTYGMTETASQVATATPAELRADPITVGRPLRTVQVDIVDTVGAGLEPGDVGEITVSGPVVSPGYLHGPSEQFEEGRFHTGDVGYRDESGRLYVTGRESAMIVTGGENVHPRRVEAAFRALEAVDDAAAVGLDDPEWGERVAVLLVTNEPATAGELEAAVVDRLSSYEIPKTIGFASAIPRTQSGTVDREAVRSLLDA